MSARRTVTREIRVAFSRRAQPVWFRLVKWTVFIAFVVVFRGHPSFWRWLMAAVAVSLTAHFVWRWKTKGWTRPWGGWNDVAAGREQP
jgi:hypothetical protein